MSCNFCKHIQPRGNTQYCPKVGNKEIIYDQSHDCQHYTPANNAPTWCKKKNHNTMNTDTPETDEIRGQYEREYISIGKILEHAEDLERERNQARQERDELAIAGYELASYANESLPRNQTEFLEGLFKRVQTFANAYEKTYGTLEKLKETK